MSIQRYQEYKKSGVEWLGDTPSTWTIKRLGYFFDERREKVSDKDFQPLSVTKNGIVPQLETAAKSDDGDNRKKVCSGDFVINSRSDRKGSSGASPLNGSVSLINTVIVPKENIEIKYAHYLFRSTSFQEEYYRYGKGIVADLWSTNYSEMKNISIPVPSLDEQIKIAAFLENETEKIDRLIAKKERLIELLKEKRQSVVSHAVTKGFDPKVKMKDSGVKWLGEIPEHWKVKAIKHVVSIPVTDGPHETPEFFDEGVPFVSAEAVSSGVIEFTKIRGFISQERHKQYSLKYLPQKGDIFMVKSGATTGITAIVETDQEFNIWSPLAVIRCNRESNPYYVLNFMRSLYFQEAVALNWNFGTQQNIGMGVIENLFCPVPSQQEQKAIAEYLTSFTKQFNTLISEANNAIELLKERRSALISAAVTGQIDVRNYQPKEAA